MPLEELIKRAIDRKTEATGFKEILCPQCFLQRGVKVPMEFRTSRIALDVVPLRDDQAYKCTYCFNTVHHGIPITRKDAEEEVWQRGGSPHLMKPTYRMDERDNEAVQERLRMLGYIE